MLVIQISSDPTLSAEALTRCRKRDAEPLPVGSIEKPSQALSDLLGPLITVAEARGARGARSAGDLMRMKCPSPAWSGPVEYVHFALCNEKIDGKSADDVVGLNWALTKAAVDFLAGPQDAGASKERTTDEASKKNAMSTCGNEDQLAKLVTWFNTN